MKKYNEYIIENTDNESNIVNDSNEIIKSVLSNFINNIEKLKKETMDKLNNVQLNNDKDDSQNNTVDKYVNQLLNSLDEIKKDGKLDELIKQCVSSISLINRENSKLLKIDPQTDDIKNSIDENKKNRELLEKLLNKARELKK